MKRFTVFTSIFSVSTLLVWAILQVALAPKASSAAVPVYEATGAMLDAINP